MRIQTLTTAALLLLLSSAAASPAYAVCSQFCNSDTSPGSFRFENAAGGCCETLTGADSIVLARHATTNVIGVCVRTGGAASWRDIRDHNGVTYSQTMMIEDMHFCMDAGADLVRVQTTGGTCGGVPIAAWPYNGHRLTIRGAADADELIGGSGEDQLCGGTGNDGLDGGPDSDDVDGLDGDDVLEGGSGDVDFVSGYNGRDFVLDVDGTGDQLRGEADDEYCVFDNLVQSGTNDVVDCGPGTGDVTANTSGQPVVLQNCEVTMSCWTY